MIAAGAGEDVKELFQRVYPSLYRYVLRLTGDADQAEDVAQEAFVRLLHQDLPESDARPWLFTVASNLVRDQARKSKRRRRLLRTDRIAPDPPAAPDEVAARTRKRRAVRVALDSLPDRDREILLMREEGFSYREIAEVVGVAHTSVGTLLARARTRLSEMLDREEEA